jgi:hypothetical protein
MKPEKQVCDFGIKKFNLTKRSKDFQRAPRPTGGGSQNGKGKNKVDTTPPVVSGILVGALSNSTVQITWKTNEETVSRLEYGTTISYGTTLYSSGSTYHSVTLTGIAASTLYNFRIIAVDLTGNTTTGANQTFTATVTPSSSNVLYLEFYGTTVSGTLWNTSTPITAAHSGLTTAEIDAVLAAVQAHYAPFNVLVTNDINIYNNTATANKQRVIFTESYEWYGNGAGGVAYINSWGWADQSPAWVFTSLLSYNTHNIAEAGAHEAGHILGCRHQVTCTNGVITSGYNWGDGITAPIMGASYNVPSGDWWIGPCSLGCTSIQDDTAIITAKIGLA